MSSARLSFGPDGETIVLTYTDGLTQKLKKITTKDAKKYKSMRTREYFNLFYAISIAMNFYRRNFSKDVVAYSDYEGSETRLKGGWTFYKEK
ncbi:MAG: hypothetical protein HQ536_02810 [Parcubacteria group bacterium]|nr:hypothetical protein [Parcubacteria group bacterium]